MIGFCFRELNLIVLKKFEKFSKLLKKTLQKIVELKAPGGRFELPFPCENALYG